MERVVTINLNGNSYQLEEPAYDALRAYMGRAEAALADNPDKAEIVRDLEQAIADKCAGHLGPGKNVINAADMKAVLEEMGPVEGETADANAQREDGAGAGEPPRKRLYRIKDGAQISGVCAGIGAYFDLDPNIVRLLFIIAALFTSGGFILVYVAMMFFIPSAHTSAEWAAAHGMPFNAQEVIDRAKREYRRFADDASRDWRSSWRAQRRAMREQMRAWRYAHRDWDHAGPPPAPATPVGYITRVFAGLFAFVFSIVSAALLIVFLLAFFTFLGTGEIMGWSPPNDIPNWLVLVVLAIAYAAISSPFRALRHTSFATAWGYRADNYGGGGLFMLAVFAASAWIAWMYVPEARQMMEQAYVVIRDFGTYWRDHWNWNWIANLAP